MEMIRQNPTGLPSIVQVQPRLEIVPDLIFRRMRQIAQRQT
jgi:hypothetical protein